MLKKTISLIKEMFKPLPTFGSNTEAHAQTQTQPQPQTQTQADPQTYKSVTIGDQVWMVENLNEDKFRNGDPVPHAESDNAWNQAGLNNQPAWCYYNNDHANGEIFGKLYNYFAVVDPRGLAPEGWRIPSDADWSKLENHSGDQGVASVKQKEEQFGVVMDFVAGGKLKEAGTAHWLSPNTGATNETGFTALPGGCRDMTGSFQDVGDYGIWWSATQDTTSEAWNRRMHFINSSVHRYHQDKACGFSVRCVRD